MALSTDFAFEGFRIIRQRPILILYWGIWGLILTGLTQYFFMSQFGPALDQLDTIVASPETEPDPAVITNLLGQLVPFYALSMLASLIFYAVINAAVYRAVNNDAKFGIGYLRFGMDEVRQALVLVAFFFLFMAAYMLIVLVGVMIGGVLSVALSSINQGMGVLGMFLAIVAVIAVVVWFLVRMSLFSVQTYYEQKFNLFGTWKLTKGNVWGLLAGYFIAWVMATFVYILFGVIFLAVAGFAGANPLAFIGEIPNMSTTELYSHPIMIGFIVVGGLILTPLTIAIITAAPAAAYKQLTIAQDLPQEEV